MCSRLPSKQQVRESFYYPVQKEITVKNWKLGIIYRGIQATLILMTCVDLFRQELYMEKEIPSGYTTIWIDPGNITQVQKHNPIPNYCLNHEYDYIFTNNWDYRNNSCIHLAYPESYEKTREDIFITTYLTEKYYNGTNELTYNNFFQVGAEELKISFDHFYTTSFSEGSNLDDQDDITTYIYDVNNNIRHTFNPGETITLSVKEWLQLLNINLNTRNTDIQADLYNRHPIFRMSGLNLILNIKYFNLESISKYKKPTCEIHLDVIEGWASLGSEVSYLKQPTCVLNMEEQRLCKNNAEFVERYKYGVRFVLLASGEMGKFNTNLLLLHLVSIIVVAQSANMWMSIVMKYCMCSYSKKFKRYLEDKITTENLQKAVKKLNINLSKFNIHRKMSKISNTEIPIPRQRCYSASHIEPCLSSSSLPDMISEDGLVDIDLTTQLYPQSIKIKINNEII